MLNHRSIRKYKNTEIAEELMQKLYTAAIRGSNTGNMQVYSIIETKDKELKKKLWENHFKQEMVLQAPVILTFVADINRFNAWCKINNANAGYDNLLWLYNATIDATIAAQNLSIAAEQNGLGICYLGTTTYMADNIIKLLELPKGVFPVTSIVLGYPDESPELTDRLPLEAIIHKEKYQDYSEQKIKDLYQEKENLKIYKEIVKENNVDNLAQVFTDKRYKKNDNIFFSEKFVKVLKEQGFYNNGSITSLEKN